jgi:hypothetical protein
MTAISARSRKPTMVETSMLSSVAGVASCGDLDPNQRRASGPVCPQARNDPLGSNPLVRLGTRERPLSAQPRHWRRLR